MVNSDVAMDGDRERYVVMYDDAATIHCIIAARFCSRLVLLYDGIYYCNDLQLVGKIQRLQYYLSTISTTMDTMYNVLRTPSLIQLTDITTSRFV